MVLNTGPLDCDLANSLVFSITWSKQNSFLNWNLFWCFKIKHKLVINLSYFLCFRNLKYILNKLLLSVNKLKKKRKIRKTFSKKIIFNFFFFKVANLILHIALKYSSLVNLEGFDDTIKTKAVSWNISSDFWGISAVMDSRCNYS